MFFLLFSCYSYEKIITFASIYANLAQLVEQRIRNA